VRQPEKIFSEMIGRLIELEALNKELEETIQAPPEWLVVDEIARKIKEAQTIFERRIK